MAMNVGLSNAYLKREGLTSIRAVDQDLLSGYGLMISANRLAVCA
jgi:hypothetical protein